MKRLVSILIALAVVGLSIPGFAGTVDKFKGGLKTVMMSPLNVSDNVKTETTNAKFMPFGLVGGLLKGGVYMAKDIVTGSLDMVTSPLDSIRK